MNGDQGEVIMFRIPRHETILFVENIHPQTGSGQLYDLFSNYGLVYDVKLFEVEGKACLYAFAKYYSIKAAHEGQRALNGCWINGTQLKVSFSKPRQNDKIFPLDIHKSIELANYYIGFNSWSTCIASLAQDSLEINEESGNHKCTYHCTIQLSLKDGRSIECAGKATSNQKDKSVAIEFAKKNAITDARKNAFGMVALIVLDSGKVAVHFVNDSMDHWK